ncbi:MAG: hypothetical protein GZ088_09450 [Acidipila sp.]|nr:hypothetical protein [Acidipila sp.]
MSMKIRRAESCAVKLRELEPGATFVFASTAADEPALHIAARARDEDVQAVIPGGAVLVMHVETGILTFCGGESIVVVVRCDAVFTF